MAYGQSRYTEIPVFVGPCGEKPENPFGDDAVTTRGMLSSFINSLDASFYRAFMSDDNEQLTPPPFIPDPSNFTPQERYDTVKQVYDQVCREFYVWEQEECRVVISSLSKDQDQGFDMSFGEEFLDLLERDCEVRTSRFRVGYRDDDEDEDEDEEEFITIHDFGCDEEETAESTSKSTLSLQTIRARPGKKVPPCPPYFSCTPSQRNMREIDKFTSDAVAFIPHADDPEFPIYDYLGNRVIAWGEEFRDPDEEALQVEVIRRLAAQRFTAQMIDDTELLGRSVRVNHAWGLLWEYSQRDALQWPATSSDLPSVRSNDPTIMSMSEEIEVGLERFCSSLNCIHNSCRVHSYSFEGPPTKAASKDSTSVWLAAGKPLVCSPGRNCARSWEQLELEQVTVDQLEWDVEDVEVLETILRLQPDVSPCDLAPMCRKPCWEVFVYRKELIKDEDIDDLNAEEDERTRIPKDFTDTLAVAEILVVRVSMQDNFVVSAAVVLKNVEYATPDAHVRIIVRDLVVVNSWVGNAILLFARGAMPRLREFNLKPVPRRKKPQRNQLPRRCQNINIQRQESPVIEIKPSKYGFGAFATSIIPPQTWIGEYIGEIHRHSDGDPWSAITVSRGILNNYRHLNYMFSLERTQEERILDAAALGNETRYLNDSKRPNCDARHYLVNGERRISFITNKKVPAGKELFISYGENYWLNKDE
ncbi:hypothetical protein VKT23_007284 [Stygiomarasmius scandens]|uniref:SET domain-containing protein n=1 Tax=Marasmiellus scandens TaxID=2682957 RepID=A0ABR1JKB7_9AGAR